MFVERDRKICLWNAFQICMERVPSPYGTRSISLSDPEGLTLPTPFLHILTALHGGFLVVFDCLQKVSLFCTTFGYLNRWLLEVNTRYLEYCNYFAYPFFFGKIRWNAFQVYFTSIPHKPSHLFWFPSSSLKSPSIFLQHCHVSEKEKPNLFYKISLEGDILSTQRM